MNVHNHAWPQTRQDLKEKIVHVAADFHRMRAIDKKNVARLQLREKFELYILHFLLNQRTHTRNAFQ